MSDAFKFFRRRVLAMVLAAGCAAFPGCAEENVARLGDFLDELEVEGPRDNAAYVLLGKFNVAMQARSEENPDKGGDSPWMRIRFRLYAETAPGNEDDLKDLAKEEHANLSDAVITVIRSSTVDDLADPRLASLKARMSEAARLILGENQFRQLVCRDITTEEL